MKKLILGLVVLSQIAFAHAAEKKADCTRASDKEVIEDKTFSISFDGTKILAESENNKFNGTFVKVVKNGALMYNSPDVTDIADQTDYGYIFVSADLAKGNKGTVTFSARQLGDSEGAWWLNSTYNCVVRK